MAEAPTVIPLADHVIITFPPRQQRPPRPRVRPRAMIRPRPPSTQHPHGGNAVPVHARHGASLDAAREIAALLPREEATPFLRRLRAAAVPNPAPAAHARLIAALTLGHAYTPDERRRLETEAVLRRIEDRRRLLDGALRTSDAARLLGRSRQAVHDRVKAGTLLAIDDGGALRFPAWQFDPNGPRDVVPGLPTLLSALRLSPLAKARWLTRPNATLEGRTPLEALRAGEIGRLLAEARGVGAAG